MDEVGRLPDGRPVRRVRLSSGDARLDVLDLGAAIDSWRPNGSDRSVVVGLGGDVDARWRHRDVYVGIVGGRYLGRIRDGRFTMDGTMWRLATNENGHTLHGGPVGFDRRTWTISAVSGDSITLDLVSEDGDQGFPGRLSASATYRVSGDSLTVDLAATTDAPTVVNLGSHPYFDVGAHPVLTVPASRWLPTDDAMVPLPGSQSVDDTWVDARSGLAVGPSLKLDATLLVDGTDHRLMARLEGANGTVEVWGDQPALQVFTAGALGGVALEAQREPDGPNRPGAAAMLRPGDTYRSRVEWRFTANR
jgi:aldose 1-epimerase